MTPSARSSRRMHPQGERQSTCGRVLVAAVLAALVAGSAPLATAASTDAPGPQIVKYFAGPGVTVPESLGGDAGGMALDSAGNLYIGVNGSGGHAYIASFDSTGKFIKSWAADGSISGRDVPLVLTVGPDGLIYAAPDTGGAGIGVFKTDGTPVRTFAANVGLTHVSGIAVGANGDLWLTSQGTSELGTDDDSVVHLSPSGAVLGRFAPLPGQHFGYNIIRGLALDPDGSLWLTVKASPSLLHFDASGHRLAAPNLTPIMGTEGASEVAVAGGRIYLTGGTDEIRSSVGVVVITPAGQLIDEIPGSAGLIAAGQNDDIYVTDYVSPTPATHRTMISGGLVMTFAGRRIESPPPGGAWGEPTGTCSGTGGDSHGVSFLNIPNTPGCRSPGAAVTFTNDITKSNPCPHGERPQLDDIFDGAQELETAGTVRSSGGDVLVSVSIPGSELKGGSVIFEYKCRDPVTGDLDNFAYEWKGEVTLLDPSGTVVDANDRPVAGATVKLVFAPTQKGPFVAPAVAGIDPQLPVEQTGATGSFSWDVADGYWRLEVSAFGYRRFTSPAYHVPPAITGLTIKLTPDPRQQARLIDPVGKVGSLSLGTRVRSGLRVTGLSFGVAGGRLDEITVHDRSFRTALGITIGSTVAALDAAYPAQSLSKLGPGASLHVARAAFTIKHGRVSSITLSR